MLYFWTVLSEKPLQNFTSECKESVWNIWEMFEIELFPTENISKMLKTDGPTLETLVEHLGFQI